MPETLYPKRTRCKKCRKLLENTPVVDGLYCSYRCAQVPRPSEKVADAPRWCKREVAGKWDFKKRFKWEGEVPEKLRNDPATNIYRCDYCRNLHVGHRAPVEASSEKLHRGVDSLKELGSVLKRHRESLKIEKKDLAKRLKIPAIRITELEEGRTETKPEVIFQVARVLRVSFEIKSR